MPKKPKSLFVTADHLIVADANGVTTEFKLPYRVKRNKAGRLYT